MDTLTSLKVFSAVAELRSFTAASDRLNLSPAMTSKHVQHLERRVGARLFNRTSRSVSLTEAGTAYFRRVAGLLDGLEEVEALIGDTTVKPRGELKISVPVWLANPRFARALAEYRLLYPEVVLNLDLEGRVVNLVDEGFDLALRGARVVDDSLIARKVADVPFRLVASTDFLDRVGRPRAIEDLLDQPLAAYGPIAGDGKVPLTVGDRPATIQFRPVLSSGNETLLMLAVRAGMGYGVMPVPMVEEDLAAGRLEIVLPELFAPQAPVFAVYPNRSYLPAKVRTFLDHIAKGGLT